MWRPPPDENRRADRRNRRLDAVALDAHIACMLITLADTQSNADSAASAIKYQFRVNIATNA